MGIKSAKSGIKGTMNAATDLAKVTKNGVKTSLKNGKAVMKGMKNGALKSAKSLDELATSLGKKLRFKQFKLSVKGMRFKLMGKVNPWVLLADGEIVYAKQSDFPRNKTAKLGDSLFYNPTGVKGQGKRGIIIGEPRLKTNPDIGSSYVERLRKDKDFAKETFNDLFAADNNAARKAIIKGASGKTYKELVQEYGTKAADAIWNRGKLSKNLEDIKPKLDKGFDDLNAHHRVPVQAIEESPLVRRALENKKNPFNFNGKENGSWVKRYSKEVRKNPDTGKTIASPKGNHASHGQYNQLIIGKLNEVDNLFKGKGKFAGRETEFLNKISDELGKKIAKLDAGQRVNDLSSKDISDIFEKVIQSMN